MNYEEWHSSPLSTPTPNTLFKKHNFLNLPIILYAAAIYLATAWHFAASAQDDDLNLEDLTKIEVSSVSRRNQSLSNVPAAAFVISADDIHRSGAQTLPDVLRMAPGIQVARIDSGRFAVTARGFNGRFSNKLQVLVDGRSIYDPFFSGTLWEHEQLPLEDIERIEIIRGVGAAMWGANAVNGVINIISKHSRSDATGMVAASIGTDGQRQLYSRAGGNIDADTSWKISAQGRHAGPSRQAANDQYSTDNLTASTVDFRFDRSLAAGTDFSIWANVANSSQGDLYPFTINPLNPMVLDAIPVTEKTTTQMLGARYRWLTGQGIESSLQSSLSNALIGLKDAFEVRYVKFDIDYQGRYTFADHDLLWGLTHRTVSDEAWSNFAFEMIIPRREFTQRSSGVFLHDNWTLVPDTWQLGFGARWDQSNLGGNFVSPSATLMWTPTRSNTLWAKYGRAPRVPSRAEFDISMISGYRGPDTGPFLSMLRSQPGSVPLHKETMEGGELGFRSQLAPQLSIDLTLYRYRYANLLSSTLGTTDVDLTFGPIPVIIQNLDRNNGATGWLSGAELSLDWLLSPAWRIQLSYALTHVDMASSSNPITEAQGKAEERGTARHTGSLRSQWNLSDRQQFDAWIRGSSSMVRALSPYTTDIHIPGYVTLDLRYAHKITRDLEIALIGRNLVGQRRIEYVADYVPATPVVIEPSVQLTTRWKF